MANAAARSADESSEKSRTSLTHLPSTEVAQAPLHRWQKSAREWTLPSSS
jgi:hypothetical protein